MAIDVARDWRSNSLPVGRSISLSVSIFGNPANPFYTASCRIALRGDGEVCSYTAFISWPRIMMNFEPFKAIVLLIPNASFVEFWSKFFTKEVAISFSSIRRTIPWRYDTPFSSQRDSGILTAGLWWIFKINVIWQHFRIPFNECLCN